LDQADRLIAGKKLRIAENAVMARSLYADAGQLGSALGWLGAAEIAWTAQQDPAACKQAAAAAQKLGGLTGSAHMRLVELQAACGK
jgi:hypothetical protein